MTKIAYKAFEKVDTVYKCRDEKFEIGKIYQKDNNITKPRLCSNEGYHYCNNLNDTFTYYSTSNEKHVYCKIEILGNFTDSSDKSITTAFRILEEIPREVIDTYIISKELKLDILSELVKKYPNIIIGGSLALILHGINLKRVIKEGPGDLDLISPYFFYPEGEISDEKITFDEKSKSSGNDYDYTFFIGTMKADVRIDPKFRYEKINFLGTTYNVCPILPILEAKIRYALNGQSKHKEDILNILNTTKIQDTKPEVLNSISDLFK